MLRLFRFLRLPAIVGPLPNLIADGQIADAGPVMANYNWILTQVNANAMPLIGGNTGLFPDPSNTAYGNGITVGSAGPLAANASGTFNTAIGQLALSASTLSSFNTAVGAGALQTFNGGAFGKNVAVGSFALLSTTGGTDNVAIGHAAMQNAGNIAGQNVAIGESTLFATTGIGGVAVGYQAAQSATSFSGCTAIGFLAVNAATTMTNCTAVGSSAMGTANGATQATALGVSALAAVTGFNCTGIGYQAGQLITSGGRNVAVGSLSMRNVTTATDNVAVGHNALIGSSSQCTAVGSGAMGSSGGAQDMTAVGFNALQNGLAAGLTAVGSGALAAASTMPNCVAVGYQALTACQNANGNNVAVGYLAAAALTTGFNQIAIGNNTAGGTSTQNGVAIGPFAMQTGNHSNCIGIGVSAGQNVTGSANVMIGYQAGLAGTPVVGGDHLTLIGDSAQCNGAAYTNSVGLGNAAIVTASNTIVLGNSSIAFIRCQVQTINVLSDGRDKSDVKDIKLGLDFINMLHPVSYRLNTSMNVKRYGFIAQEVQEALKRHTYDATMTENRIGDEAGGNLAILCRENDERGTYLLGYNELIAPMVRAIKELTARIQLLEKKQV